jgi:hypothetical protein
VVKTSEVLTFLETLPAGMYDLPSGKSPATQQAKRAANF